VYMYLKNFRYTRNIQQMAKAKYILIL